MIEGAELKTAFTLALPLIGKLLVSKKTQGSFDPEVATFVMAEYAKKWVSKIFTNCAARGLETQAGVISDVVTEKRTN